MGKKYEIISVIIIVVHFIMAGFLIGFYVYDTGREMGENELRINDTIIIINGTIEEINLKTDFLYVIIDDKTYEIGEYIHDKIGDGKTHEDWLFFYYLSINEGDNITIFKSDRIIINGVLYQEGFLDLITSMVLGSVIIAIGIILGIVVLFVGMYYAGETIIDLERTIKKKNESIEYFKQKHERLQTRYNELQKSNQTRKVDKENRYCQDCGTIVTKQTSHCLFCGSEVEYVKF